MNVSPNKSGWPYIKVACKIGNKENIKSDALKNTFSFSILKAFIKAFIKILNDVIV